MMIEEKTDPSSSSSSDEKMAAVSSSSSSSSEDDSDDDSSSDNKDGSVSSAPLESSSASSSAHHHQLATRGYSRLFSPYRTLGIVADGPFHLIPNQNSASAMVCAAIGERFHLVQCDKLHPVLVSHSVPGTKQQTLQQKQQGPSGPQKIYHLVSDNSLSVTVATHGFVSPGGKHSDGPKRVSLFQRTRALATLDHLSDGNDSDGDDDGDDVDWSIVDLLHLGKIKMTMKGEKQDKKENAALIAVVLSKGKPYDETIDGVPVVGDEDDDSESDSGSDSDHDSSDDSEAPPTKRNTNNNQYRGEIVLLVASRTSLTVHKRIKLTKFPSFCPKVAMHPPTYVNKIILGGSCAKTSKDALVLLNVRTGKIIHTFKCLDNYAPGVRSEITSLEASPAIDSIATGNSKGVVHLINIRYDKLLFSLKHEPRNDSTKPVRITSMSFRTDGSALQYEIAPLAVGRSDGTITIWDLSPPNEEDDDDDFGGASCGRTILCEMERAHYPGGVCKLQYLPQEPLLISTGTRSNSLVMHVFDNPDHSGRILRQRRGHTAPPKCIRYLHPGAGAGGGVLANMGDGTDARACQILSGGSTDRTVRKFSTVRSVLDKEFSQGKGLEKKAKELGMLSKADLLLPPVTAMTTSEMRTRDWGDLVSIHRDHAFAYVWSSKNGAQSGPVLRQDTWNVSVMKRPPPKSAHATSLSMSTCGNYALVGTKGGVIYKYNVQSGMTRGTYPIDESYKKNKRRMKDAGDIRRTFKELEKKMKLSNRASNQEKEEHDRVLNNKLEELRSAKLRLASHEGYAVTGIAVDSVNRTVISVGADAKLILWSFKTHAPHKKSPSILPAPASKLCHVKDSDLAAIALNDFSTILFDCSTLTIVRRFGFGSKSIRHTGPISDFGFSPDARTLYTSSLDGTIRVWDVPTNSCVDWMSFDTPPTSLTVSPTGEFLATTHTGKLGISLWSDRSFYQTVHVDGTLALSAPSRMDDPAPVAETGNDDDDEDNRKQLLKLMSSGFGGDTKESTADEEEPRGPAKAREEGLITLSGLPPAHWKNLFHLELVKERNKPKEPPKKPPSAPFFLQWRPGVDATGEPSTNVETNAKNGSQSNDDDQWDAVWSDDDDDEKKGTDTEILPDGLPPKEGEPKRARSEKEVKNEEPVSKRQKVSIYRSKLASLLEECSEKSKRSSPRDNKNTFAPVTEYVGTLGPSAIDVSLSTLCNGMHDLEDGLPLLILASQWLIQACQSRERFDAVNAYLHRFLYLHANILSGIDETSGIGMEKSPDETEEEEELKQKRREIQQRNELASCIAHLKQAQKDGSVTLQEDMQNALCLLRHFSRMV
jgi:U3 small nucleolar RNA-associated protein 21